MRPKPRCPTCHHPDYTTGIAADGRPCFTCVKCGRWWTCGKDGGEWADNAHTTEARKAVARDE